MATQYAPVTTTKTDIKASPTSITGGTRLIQNLGPNIVHIHEGASEPTDAQPGRRILMGETITLLMGSAKLWAWAPTGTATLVVDPVV